MTVSVNLCYYQKVRKPKTFLLAGADKILSEALERIYAKTRIGFVFIIDEWDCVFRENQKAEALHKKYLDFLRDLLKDQPYVKLAYMTGILPVKKYGTHSALNMFMECSMVQPRGLAEYIGFTESEVKELCSRYDMDFEETRRWYNGYQFPGIPQIYNPKSVVEAMLSGIFANYWTATETYEALKVYIEMDFDGLKEAVVGMLGGGRSKVDPSHFQNDMSTFETRDDVLTLLIHLGYLAYDSVSQEVSIPNKEIADEFASAVRATGWQEIIRVLKDSEQLLAATIEGREDDVAQALDRVHAESASVLQYNDENSLSCAITLAYYSARKSYMMIREMPTGKGFADIVFLPICGNEMPAILVELKWNQEASTALDQIRDKHYTQAFEGYVGNIVLVGITYDKVSKCHACRIEVVAKA